MKKYFWILIFSVPALANQEFGVKCNNFEGVEKVNVRVEIPQSLMGCATPCGAQSIEVGKFNADAFAEASKILPAEKYPKSQIILRPEYYQQTTKISGYQIELWLESANHPTIVYLKSALAVWNSVNGKPDVIAGGAFIASKNLDRRGVLNGYYVSPTEDFALLCKLIE